MRKLRDLYLSGKSSSKKSAFKSSRLTPGVKKTTRLFKVLIVFLVLFILVLNFNFAGQATASFLINRLDPVSFFRNGKFLLVFQNDSEQRPSGGFIGSFAVLQTQDFEVKNITFDTNIYKLDSAYTATHYIKAPAPLAKFIEGKSWTLRDSNYAVSFPEAAADIDRFYEAESGDHVDGVVAIDASTLVDLLKLTGPIDMPQYQTTITAANFFSETQYQVEQGYFNDPQNWVQNEPKTIIKDLYPKIISKALAQNKMSLLQLAKSDLKNKEVQFYFKDAQAEQKILAAGWGGQVDDLAELQSITGGLIPDYLNINVANFGGNKSSFSVSQQIEYSTAGKEADLSITRIHHGSDVWPDGVNASYIRVLVPQNSILKEATLNGRDILTSVDVDVESGKTTFGTTVDVGPGQAAVLKLQYELPENFQNYNLVFQKQSGATENSLNVIHSGKVLFNGEVKNDLIIR
ncbi:MAG: DUF4012 domain-containing protein [Patescibacteria group bacterium]